MQGNWKTPNKVLKLIIVNHLLYCENGLVTVKQLLLYIFTCRRWWLALLLHKMLLILDFDWRLLTGMNGNACPFLGQLSTLQLTFDCGSTLHSIPPNLMLWHSFLPLHCSIIKGTKVLFERKKGLTATNQCSILVLPAVARACPNSRSTSFHQWRCWWDCGRFGCPPHWHNTRGAANRNQNFFFSSLLLHLNASESVYGVYYTVCAAADRGVLWIGVRLLLLLSHRTICPEYVPPTTTLGWNLANDADITADCQREGQETFKVRHADDRPLLMNCHVACCHTKRKQILGPCHQCTVHHSAQRQWAKHLNFNYIGHLRTEKPEEACFWIWSQLFVHSGSCFCFSPAHYSHCKWHLFIIVCHIKEFSSTLYKSKQVPNLEKAGSNLIILENLVFFIE